MGYIFISYSNANRESAEAIRNLFNNHGFETWMASNDIPPGKEYAEVINKAIKNCQCFTLLLTQESQESVWVSKEVERAIHYQKLVVPISLDDVILNDKFEFYISTNQIVPVRTISDDSKEIQRVLKALSAYIEPDPEGQELCDLEVNSKTMTEKSWEYYSLGFSYEFGEDNPINYEMAVKYYLKSAELGNAWSQHRLGECYYYGRGVNCNYDLAFYWLKLSSEQNNQGAYPLLAECYEKGLGTQINTELSLLLKSKIKD